MSHTSQGVVVNTDLLYNVSPDMRPLGRLNGQDLPPGTILVQRIQMGSRSNTGRTLTYAFPLELSDILSKILLNIPFASTLFNIIPVENKN